MASEEDTPQSTARAGEVYGKVLADLLTLETTRKASIEQRGITFITTSGGLVSLLVALSALLLGRDSSAPLGGSSRFLLIAAVIAFIVAASLGLAANAPRDYGGLSTEDLDRIIADRSWSGNKDGSPTLASAPATQRRSERFGARRCRSKERTRGASGGLVYEPKRQTREVSFTRSAPRSTPPERQEDQRFSSNSAAPEDDQRFHWSALVWSPPPESNRRPHPYHGTTRNRCAEPRFPARAGPWVPKLSVIYR